jgi:tRNA (uracil-5-)-methyltransferase TRM9
MPRTVTPATISETPQDHEDLHVHVVYDQIASHFSSTRYKVCPYFLNVDSDVLQTQPWPVVAEFLSNIPAGWIGLDSGTGNGKYLQLPSDPPGKTWMIGLDRSRKLLEIAKNAGEERREVVLGDVLGHGWRAGTFVRAAVLPLRLTARLESHRPSQDYAISIATIHHLSTYERRQLAVQSLLHCVSPEHGRVLIYVWAIEQDELSKLTVPQAHSAENDDALGQDVFVPWVMSDGNLEQKGPTPLYNRYYHMFAKGELRKVVLDAAQHLGLFVGSKESNPSVTRGLEIVQDGWSRSNYYIEFHCWKC